MLLLPDDHRQNEEELRAAFTAAKIRVYQYALEVCQDVRALVEEAGTDDVEKAAEFANRVTFGAFREDETHDIDLRIDIEIEDGKTTSNAKSGKLIRRQGIWMELKEGIVHEVVGMVSSPLRTAIADVSLPPMQQAFLDNMEEEGNYGEMDELREKFDMLYAYIVAGKWPKKRLTPRGWRPGGAGSL